MLSLKPGVSVAVLQPQTVLMAGIIKSIFDRLGANCVITSGCDGQHLPTSFHYKGLALDFRTRDLTQEQLRLLVGLAKEALGLGEWDVVMEEDHLHIEYQIHPSPINPKPSNGS